MAFFKTDGTVDARLLHLAEWIVAAGLKNLGPELLLQELSARLGAAGLPIDRVQVAFRVLHPLFSAMMVTCDENGPHIDYTDDTVPENSQGFTRSPFATLINENLKRLRHRLDDAAAVARYPILQDLRGRGFTDYVAFLVSFTDPPDPMAANRGVVISWATRAPGGFADDGVEALGWLTQPLALTQKVEINGQIAANALRTFHGAAVGARILGGTIRRGAGERLRTVVWYSDLRNSTRLSERLPLDAFLAVLNSYFECSAGAVMAAGGQVLELIGDAVLAIFPVEATDGDGAACTSAIAAARDAHARLQALAASSPEVAKHIAFGTGLHIGDLIFGNVGTAERLNFGLVGSAVSETARLESLTKTLGRPVLVSDRMAALLDEPLEDLGRHALRGVETPRRIWALPQAASTLRLQSVSSASPARTVGSGAL